MPYNQYELKLEERYKSYNPLLNKALKCKDIKFKLLLVEEELTKLEKEKKNLQNQKYKLDSELADDIIKYGKDFTKYVPKE